MLARRTPSIAAAIFCTFFGCSQPHLPPTTVPAPANPQLQPFTQAVKTYVDKTQPFRKEAAQEQSNVPGHAGQTSQAAEAVRVRQRTLAEAIRTKVRPNAKQGDLFVPSAAPVLRDTIAALYKSPKRDLLMDEMTEQNEGTHAPSTRIVIGDHIDAPSAPPLLIEALPQLPKQLEYDFLGRALILRDTDADVVVDYLPDALPAAPAQTEAPPSTAPQPRGVATLAMPELSGGVIFVMMGDMGSGDQAQAAVAQALLDYFTKTRRFRFVLMLGDNLYDDDYNGEFLEPYKPLLDRGVKFYAALGNHDRDLEIHFKPFNMEDRDRYSFDEGNARFVALNSNHPGDPAQIAFLDSVFDGAGTKWRICFFHHPLYSSGQHATESREVIRPALEPALIRNHVNLVFSGHEHLYERIKPQHGIRYFVSGGGGRSLYSVHPSEFDEVAVSEHHFMVGEIAGDAFLFEAVRPNGSLIDCGVDYRVNSAADKHDKDIDTWLSSCHAAVARTTH